MRAFAYLAAATIGIIPLTTGSQAKAENRPIQRERLSTISIYEATNPSLKYDCIIYYWVPIIGTDFDGYTFPCKGEGIDQGRGTYTKLRYGRPSQSGDYPYAYFNDQMKRRLNTADILTIRPEFNNRGEVTSRVYPYRRSGSLLGGQVRTGPGRAPRWLCMDKETWKTGGNKSYTTFRILTNNRNEPLTAATKQGCMSKKPGSADGSKPGLISPSGSSKKQ